MKSAERWKFKTWNEIDWSHVNNSIRKIQYRIYEESRLDNSKQLYKLQRWLTRNPLAKYKAVLQVTTLNKNPKSKASYDKTVTSPKEKFDLAMKLQLDGKSAPIRRVWIEKPGKREKRPLAIATIEDRAKQALAKIVLEPEWEARFEASSYGFRPGRSPHDAIAKTSKALSKQTVKWIIDAHIRKCFDSIDHEALLAKINTFPEMKKQIRAWLKAGIMEKYANEEKDDFTIPDKAIAQGGTISPLLANIALHGLESYLKDQATKIKGQAYPGNTNKTRVKESSLAIIRYADDFIVIDRNKEILLQMIPKIQSWLSLMKLELDQEKTMLRDGRKGFTFLGFRFILTRRKSKIYKIKIYPAKECQISVMKKIRKATLEKGKALSSYTLIQRLRPIIFGWGNYFSICECQTVYRKISFGIFSLLRKWVFRRDRKHGRHKVKEKYFPSGKSYIYDGRKYQDNWTLVGKQKKKNGEIQENFLPQMSWIKSRKHVLVKGTSTPFDKKVELDWSLRTENQSSFST